MCTYILNSSRCILLGHVVTVYLAFLGTAKLFHSSCINLDFHEQYVRVSIFLGHCQYLLLSIFFIRAHFVGVKWYLIVVLVYIFLETTDVSIFLCAYWPYIILNIYSNVQILCPFFKLSCLCYYQVLHMLYIYVMSLLRYMIYKKFLPFNRCLFTFLNVLYEAEVFKFLCYLVYFLFCGQGHEDSHLYFL